MSRASAKPMRVGVVGASPDRGWARAAHLPALLGLPEFAVTAVATTRLDSARRAAAEFGVPHAFADARELAAHPDVDAVSVVVKAPRHAEVIRAALANGKHVVSEWPLGVDLAEAVELAEEADKAGVVHAVVLQGYVSPAAGLVREQIARGRIGRLESISVVAPGDPLGGSRIPADLVWSLDPAAGMNLLTIMAGHVLATVEHLAGPLAEVSATVANRHREVVVAGTGETLPSGVPTQVTLHGRLESGALATVSVHGGGAESPDAFHLRIDGSEGALTAVPVQRGMYLHWGEWEITHSGAGGDPGDDSARPVAGDLTGPEGAAGHSGVPEAGGDVAAGPANVAVLYREFALAVAAGREAYPSFHTAVRQHRVLAAVEDASRTGARQVITLTR